MWAHVTCDDGNRVALQFGGNDIGEAIQVGDHVQWDDDSRI